MLLPAAIQTSQRSPLRVRSGNVNATWPIWVLSGTGRTLRLRRPTGAAISSRLVASGTIFGCS